MEYPLTNSKFVEIELEEEITTEQEKYPLSSRRPALGCFVYFRGFLFGRKCHSTARLNGKTVVITGGNTGIGKETALDLASRGAKVIIACRDVQKGYETVNDISEKVQKPDVVVKRLDLASFASIKSFAQDVLENEPYIHILINNAGVAACPKSLTEDGYEMQFGVNHLGHFLLTHLLLDRIKASVPARIINVSSIAHIYGHIDFNDINLNSNYRPIQAYCRSKLANILFTRELAKRLKGSGVTTYCLHPGAIHTGLGQHMGSSINKFVGQLYEFCSRLLFKSPTKGAQTTIYCAVEEKLANESGHYYCDCSVINPSSKAQDDSLARQLWDVSEYLIAKAL
ncbi:retinol dehydrogenase 11-like isoform X1 [Argiope bruennichi]|uniref:retinol dehydrogenase 11-like isoform X1 n=1 Tax=Argiope bruennichi TaxID=94029 RepID=UPI0024959F98|nr:retinol dehydrogenase 11-like isoform X1 [Argiope bruennichi]